MTPSRSGRIPAVRISFGTLALRDDSGTLVAGDEERRRPAPATVSGNYKRY